MNEQAQSLLRSLCTEQGILASAIESDNYRRIWARDSIIAGLTGLILEDRQLTQGLKRSLVTLGEFQHELGMIPSNVEPDSGDVSYGSLTGRIDASTWYIIGCGLYYLNSQDQEFYDNAFPSIVNALSFLGRVEFNARGWIYTPLSGNWADEYPVHGFTLYDNALYLWALRLLEKIDPRVFRTEESHTLRLKTNFWPGTGGREHIYHQVGFEQAAKENPNHYACFILPGYYDLRFDTAGNALAMLVLGLNDDQKARIGSQLTNLENELGKRVVPAFWPVIEKGQPDWRLLAHNYSYAFKNEPGHFHNGGIWPVWTGLFCLGLAANGLSEQAICLYETYLSLIESGTGWDFDEYHYVYDLSARGKQKMAYTASGILLMEMARSGVETAKSRLFLDL